MLRQMVSNMSRPKLALCVLLFVVFIGVVVVQVVIVVTEPAYFISAFQVTTTATNPWGTGTVAFPAMILCPTPNVTSAIPQPGVIGNVSCSYLPKSGAPTALTVEATTPGVKLILPGFSQSALEFGCVTVNAAQTSASGTKVVATNVDDSLSCETEGESDLLVWFYNPASPTQQSYPPAANEGWVFASSDVVTSFSLTSQQVHTTASAVVYNYLIQSTAEAPWLTPFLNTFFTINFATSAVVDLHPFSTFTPMSVTTFLAAMLTLLVLLFIFCGRFIDQYSAGASYSPLEQQGPSGRGSYNTL